MVAQRDRAHLGERCHFLRSQTYFGEASSAFGYATSIGG